MQRTLFGMVLLALACSSANAALLSRAGGLAYYDDVLDITWVADANLAQTSGYDADGLMTWSAAVAWAASLNDQNAGLGYLGTNDWRLPTVEPLNGSTFNRSPSFNGSTDVGYNPSEQGTAYAGSTGSEMAHLFYNTLDNKGFCDPLLSTGSVCSGPQAGWGLSNVGPFSNLQPNYYWSGTEYWPDPIITWFFNFNFGFQDGTANGDAFYAWAVRPGDIGVVPFPDADGDGVADAIDTDDDNDTVLDTVDNCTLLVNPTQCDSDGDGFGNRCDGDLNNNGGTNAFDTPLYRAQLGQPSVAPTYNKADLNCSGGVNAFDTPIFRSLLGSPPGPSGLVP